MPNFFHDFLEGPGTIYSNLDSFKPEILEILHMDPNKPDSLEYKAVGDFYLWEKMRKEADENELRKKVKEEILREGEK